MSASTAEQAPPGALLLQQLTGRWLTDMLACVARLGVADELAAGPRTVAEVAAAIDADEQALGRVLRALASTGVFAHSGDSTFALTPMGECLRSDVPGSLRELAIMLGQEWHGRAWERLGDAITAGAIPFEAAHGSPFFDWIQRDPPAAANFDAAMAAFADLTHAAIVGSYGFEGIGTLVDVGGGQGALIAAILRAHPSLQGVLFDLPPVIARAREAMPRDVIARCDLVSGDFFRSLPPGADAYLLTTILHDWDDERALEILRTCRRAAGPETRVLIGEQVLPDDDGPFFGKLLDIEMLALVGGRERTAEEYEGLLAQAGFRVERIVPTAGPTSVIEAWPAG